MSSDWEVMWQVIIVLASVITIIVSAIGIPIWLADRSIRKAKAIKAKEREEERYVKASELEVKKLQLELELEIKKAENKELDK